MGSSSELALSRPRTPEEDQSDQRKRPASSRVASRSGDGKHYGQNNSRKPQSARAAADRDRTGQYKLREKDEKVAEKLAKEAAKRTVTPARNTNQYIKQVPHRKK
eukprot:1185403-Prorocentrum_minimum.AAC.5